ncbi:hypothetical protein BXZ70DRAFT_280899 [Cristinia sonorae]|uniref:Uncharacterized protein n=1 Tax=Cristinia sonorae TaxID=1940300 RepID=A0A8K0UYZ2_9AGAR|nr:hypothetical protein BXZ70DRAFT_280899 [Cristinia sonorae]
MCSPSVIWVRWNSWIRGSPAIQFSGEVCSRFHERQTLKMKGFWVWCGVGEYRNTLRLVNGPLCLLFVLTMIPPVNTNYITPLPLEYRLPPCFKLGMIPGVYHRRPALHFETVAVQSNPAYRCAGGGGLNVSSLGVSELQSKSLGEASRDLLSVQGRHRPELAFHG